MVLFGCGFRASFTEGVNPLLYTGIREDAFSALEELLQKSRLAFQLFILKGLQNHFEFVQVFANQ